jgi:hypothetical protein
MDLKKGHEIIKYFISNGEWRKSNKNVIRTNSHYLHFIKENIHTQFTKKFATI